MQTAAALANTFGSSAAAVRIAEIASKQQAVQDIDKKLASIKRAKDDSIISAEDATKQGNQALREMSGPSLRTAPHQEETILDAIRAAQEVPGSTFEASNSEGAVKLALGSHTLSPEDIKLASATRTVKPVEYLILCGGPSNFYNGFGKETSSGFTLNKAPTTLEEVSDYCNETKGNVTRDLYWANFIEPVHRLFRSEIAKPKPGDIVTIMLYRPPYDFRAERDWDSSPWNTMAWHDSPWVSGKDSYDPYVRISDQGNTPVISIPTLPKVPKKSDPGKVPVSASEARIDHEILMRTTREDLRPGQTYGMRPRQTHSWLDAIHDLPRRVMFGDMLGGKSLIPGVQVKLLVCPDEVSILNYITEGAFDDAVYWRHMLDVASFEDDIPDQDPFDKTTRIFDVAASRPKKGVDIAHWKKTPAGDSSFHCLPRTLATVMRMPFF